MGETDTASTAHHEQMCAQIVAGQVGVEIAIVTAAQISGGSPRRAGMIAQRRYMDAGHVMNARALEGAAALGGA